MPGIDSTTSASVGSKSRKPKSGLPYLGEGASWLNFCNDLLHSNLVQTFYHVMRLALLLTVFLFVF